MSSVTSAVSRTRLTPIQDHLVGDGDTGHVRRLVDPTALVHLDDRDSAFGAAHRDRGALPSLQDPHERHASALLSGEVEDELRVLADLDGVEHSNGAMIQKHVHEVTPTRSCRTRGPMTSSKIRILV